MLPASSRRMRHGYGQAPARRAARDVVGAPDRLLHEDGEHGPQPLLLVRGGDDEDRVVAREPRVEVDGMAVGTGERADRRFGPRPQDDLDRGVDRAAELRLLAPERSTGGERGAGIAGGVGELGLPLGLDRAGDVLDEVDGPLVEGQRRRGRPGRRAPSASIRRKTLDDLGVDVVPAARRSSGPPRSRSRPSGVFGPTSRLRILSASATFWVSTHRTTSASPRPSSAAACR